MRSRLAAIAVFFFAEAMISPAVFGQMAAIQLTNPSVDAVNANATAAWVADENMGVLYCELTADTTNAQKRVICYDSKGEVSPKPQAPPRH